MAITVTVMLGGQVSAKTKWDTSDNAGLSIARMAIDDMVSYAEIKAERYNVNYRVSIRKGRHEMVLMDAPDGNTVALLDGKPTEPIQTGSDRFTIVSEFIGY